MALPFLFSFSSRWVRVNLAWIFLSHEKAERRLFFSGFCLAEIDSTATKKKKLLKWRWTMDLHSGLLWTLFWVGEVLIGVSICSRRVDDPPWEHGGFLCWMSWLSYTWWLCVSRCFWTCAGIVGAKWRRIASACRVAELYVSSLLQHVGSGPASEQTKHPDRPHAYAKQISLHGRIIHNNNTSVIVSVDLPYY